jgi:hypothetical protein
MLVNENVTPTPINPLAPNELLLFTPLHICSNINTDPLGETPDPAWMSKLSHSTSPSVPESPTASELGHKFLQFPRSETPAEAAAQIA